MTRKMFPLLLLAAAGWALAHDQWIQPAEFYVDANQTVTVRCGNGTIYVKSENAVAPDRLALLKAAGPEGEVAVGEPRISGHFLEMDVEVGKAGNYWVALATKPRHISLSGKDFNGYLEHDGLPHVLKAREEEGILDRAETEEYSKYVKTYLRAGDALSGNHDQPLGLKIEIVPLSNPYALGVGDQLPVQVLLDGEPIEGFYLHAGYEGQEKEPVHVYTDGEGKAAVELSAAGAWYVRGIHLVRVDKEDQSYESYWATLTFGVR